MSSSRIKFAPKFEKIVELLLYLAHKRPNADHYQAVKFLYLADREHFNRHGRPITFEKYCALPYGPVASNAYELLKNPEKTLHKFGITQLPFETEHLDKVVYIRKPKRAVNHDLFSKSDLKVFDQVIERYGQKSFGDLYAITHEHFAYRNAWENKQDGKKSAPMSYDDMLEEASSKAEYIEEIEGLAGFM